MARARTHYDEMETSRLITEEKERLAMKAATYEAMWDRYMAALGRFLIIGTACLGIAGTVVILFP